MSDVTDIISHELKRLESGTLDGAAAKASYIAVLAPLLERSGYPVEPHPRVAGVDLVGRDPEPDSDSWFTTLGVVLKYRSKDQPVGVSEISDNFQLLPTALDRLLILSNTGFTTDAQEVAADSHNTYVLQLMDLAGLQHWVQRAIGPLHDGLSRVARAVKQLSRDLAREIACRPDALSEIEWRDLERLTAEVFEALGFHVQLTPPAKDGGKDIVLACEIGDGRATFLVEVKHWVSGKRVGLARVKEFLKVIVREQAARGLMLSTSGYVEGIAEGLTSIERQKVLLGGHEKVVALCQMFSRAESSLWSPPDKLPDLILCGTL